MRQPRRSSCSSSSLSSSRRVLRGALIACALLAAPASARAAGGGAGGATAPPPTNVVIVQQQPAPVQQPVQPPPPVLQQQPVQEEGLFGRRNLLTAVRVGPSLAVAGPLSQAGATAGVYADLLLGLQTRIGLSLSLHGGLRYQPSDRLTQFDWQIGAILRYTIAPYLVLHPWIEAGADLGGTTVSAPMMTSGRASAYGLRFSAAAGAGVEWDMSANFSLELGVRSEFLFASHLYTDAVLGAANAGMPTQLVSRGIDILLTPMVGLTWYR